MTQYALIINKKDNVATALKHLAKADRIHLKFEDRAVEVILSQAIPFGHKFALSNIDRGGAVVKYGEKIGTASEVINKGDHVHLHNMEGFRGRGDINAL
jgi:altronate dehydratase small subunit